MNRKIIILCFAILFNLSVNAIIKVACIGNSITYGYELDNRDENCYPAQLAGLLGAEYEVKNFGISARTMLNNGDLPYMKEQLFKDAISYNPDIVIIKLGTNDTKPHNWMYHNEFAHDMQIMIDNFRSLPSKPEIYLCYPGKIYQTTWGINDSIITNCIIPTIDHLAETNTLNIIDLHSATDNMKEHFKDNVHPDSYGASVIAKTVFENIRCKIDK